jgi:hypothetical protein
MNASRPEFNGKAENKALFAAWKRQRGMILSTTPRIKSDRTAERREIITVLNWPTNRAGRKPRGQTVEPMQAVVKHIFAL